MDAFIELKKPVFKSPCNGCGYCCVTEPCALAQEFLKASQGPCPALELGPEQTRCGLVRNPLGYLYRVSHPGAKEVATGPALESLAGHELSVRLASALGLGLGCDSDDSPQSEAWVLRLRG